MDHVDNIIIVLGNHNESDGTLSAIAKSRVEAAAELYKKLSGDNSRFIFTGGANELTNCTERPHAHYMADYLVELGISRSAIIEEHSESLVTLEDAKFAKPIIEQHADKNTIIYIVTSEFHTARAKVTFHQVLEGQYPIITYAAKNVGSQELVKEKKGNESKGIREIFPDADWISILNQKQMAALGSNSAHLWRR